MSTAAASASVSETKEQAIPLSDVLQKLPNSLLTEFASGVNLKIKSSASKKVIAEALVNEAYAQGTQILLKQLDKDQLKATVDALGLTVETKDKSKLLKKINEKLKEQKTLDDFLDQLTKEVLLEFCKALDFEEDTTDKGELINAVSDETIIVGMRHLFDKMTREFVEDVAKGVGTKVSGTKKEVINRVLSLSYKQLLEEKKAPGENKEKRTDRTHLDIKKGVTADELFQTYYASEMRNYCREHGLLLHGSRRDLCKRIIAFLNGDEVSTKKGATKKRKRSEKSKEKKGKKKAEEKKGEDKKGDEAAAAKPAEKKDTTAAAEKKDAAPAEEKKDAAAAAAPAAESKSEKPAAKRTKKC